MAPSTPSLPAGLAVEERFVRSSGPGGQNVNKVATAVELRVHVGSAPFAEPVKARLRALAGTRLTDDDVIVIDARTSRSQSQNREDARGRLAALIAAASRPPKTRRATRPTKSSKAARLDQKQRRSRIKQARRSSGDD
jgi:ribosome-associated protein